VGKYQDKRFVISFVVSCKDMDCRAEEAKCHDCLEGVLGQSIRKFEGLRTSAITTGNGSKQFGVSFTATCRKPDCSATVPRGVACCTSSADKCEMCLATIAGRSVREMAGLHVKEIVVV
jgi:hypothetical protein